MCLAGYLCAPIMTCQIRRRVAERFNLDEGCCMSVICCYFCMYCSLCQTHRELTYHNSWPGGTCCQREPPAPQSLQ